MTILCNYLFIYEVLHQIQRRLKVLCTTKEKPTLVGLSPVAQGHRLRMFAEFSLVFPMWCQYVQSQTGNW